MIHDMRTKARKAPTRIFFKRRVGSKSLAVNPGDLLQNKDRETWVAFQVSNISFYNFIHDYKYL